MFLRVTAWIGALTLFTASLPALSADIAFVPEFGTNALYILRSDTHVVTKTPVGLAHIQELTYSRINKMIAFIGSRTDEGRHHLYLMSWPATRLQLVPDAPYRPMPYRPQFDPDGKYVYAVNYGSAIFRYSLRDHDWKQIPVVGVLDLHIQQLTFSPSGHLAAISPGDFKGFVIASTDADHFTVVRSILTDFDSCISAHWLDETHIVFLGRKVPGLQYVWTVDIETGTTQQLTHPPVGTRDFMSLSADGRSLAFTATDSEKPEWTVWSLLLGATAPMKLLPGKDEDSYLFPTWLN